MGNLLFPFHVTMKVAGYILIHKCRQYRNSKERLVAIYVIYIFYKIGTNLRMQKSKKFCRRAHTYGWQPANSSNAMTHHAYQG